MSRRFSLCCRAIALLFIAASASGCYVWRTQPVALAQLTDNQRTSTIRITRNDGSQLIVEQLSVQGDTLIGLVRSTPATVQEIRVPRSDVREVAKQRVSVWRTALLVAPFASYAAMSVLVGYACRGGREC